jgi:hypothetical protein
MVTPAFTRNYLRPLFFSGRKFASLVLGRDVRRRCQSNPERQRTGYNRCISPTCIIHFAPGHFATQTEHSRQKIHRIVKSKGLGSHNLLQLTTFLNAIALPRQLVAQNNRRNFLDRIERFLYFTIFTKCLCSFLSSSPVKH